jgi:hypothetical protein
MDLTTRLRGAFLTSIADLFLGASSILLMLVVLAGSAAENEIARFVDRQLWCQRAEGAGWLLTVGKGGPVWTLQEWFEKETHGALLIRVGLWVARNEVDCYRQFELASRRHNARLIQRGRVTASVAPILLPGDGGRASAGGAP